MAKSNPRMIPGQLPSGRHALRTFAVTLVLMACFCASAMAQTTDLSITKNGPASIGAGDNITYTVTVTNNGPIDATGVQLSDALPPGTTFVSENQTSGPSFSCVNPSVGANGTVSCTLTTLVNGASAAFTIVFNVGSLATNTVLTNTATISSATPDSNSANNSSSSSATVVATDLSITKNGPASVNAGANITYTVNIANNGPVDAAGVQITDFLPPGATFVSELQTSGPSFNCVNPSVGGTGSVNCTLATMVNGATASFTIVFKVGSGLPNGTTLTNVATVSSTTSDSNPANNSSSSSATVGASADLSVTKTGPATIAANSNITYAVTVTNNGPTDAASVAFSDALPPGTTFVSENQTSGPSFNCINPSVGGTGSVSCGIITLTNGASASFTIVFKVGSNVPMGSTITNVVAVGSSTPDPNSANNSASSSASSIAAAPPTPAPSSLLLMLTGLGVLFLGMRRWRMRVTIQ